MSSSHPTFLPIQPMTVKFASCIRVHKSYKRSLIFPQVLNTALRRTLGNSLWKWLSGPLPHFKSIALTYSILQANLESWDLGNLIRPDGQENHPGRRNLTNTWWMYLFPGLSFAGWEKKAGAHTQFLSQLIWRQIPVWIMSNGVFFCTPTQRVCILVSLAAGKVWGQSVVC